MSEPSLNRLLTVKQTAHALGVSTKTIRRMVAGGKLVTHRFSRNLLRVDGESVMRLLAAEPAVEGALNVKGRNGSSIEPGGKPGPVRYKVYEEKGRGFVVRYYGPDGNRHSHRIQPDRSGRPSNLEEAEVIAAIWVEANVLPSERRSRRPARVFAGPTFEQFATDWFEGKLNQRWPDHVKLKTSANDDKARLKRYVFPIVGHEPIAAFDGEYGLDLAEQVLVSLPSEAEGFSSSSRRQVLQVMRRVLNLAHYPARLIKANPLPKGFVPQSKSDRAKSYVFPSEDARLMGCPEVPVLLRIFFGFLAREGMRVSEALSLSWADLDLEHDVVHLDENKSDDPRMWALDASVAEALRRWRKHLGPSVASDRSVLVGSDGEPIDPYEAARDLRRCLVLAGVTRPQLFERSDKRIPIRAHDLRASFVTVNLALGRTEAWITDRTGHQSSEMIYGYKRAARMHQELNLGAFAPLAEAIPELRALGPNP